MIREDEIVRRLGEILTVEQVQTAVPLRSMTTMKVGGPADVVVTPYGKEQTKQVLSFLAEEAVPYLVLGRGSNMIASDIGYDGVIVRIQENLQNVSVQGNIMVAEAGASLTSLARLAAAKSLSGLEFASGIPGVLGGAVYMNAGAYGGEMKDLVQEVEVFDRAGKVLRLDRSDMMFGQRSSILQQKSWVVLSAVLQLSEGNRDDIEAKMKDLNARRREKQPLELPSAGSVFKRPEGYYAGALIEQAGLKGFSVGGAQVSTKHAGFIVNTGNATCQDILDLIHEIQRRVREQFGVELEPEVRYLAPGGLDTLR